MPVDKETKEAFELWEKLHQLESLLLDRYFNEFAQIFEDKSKTDSSDGHHDVNWPF